MVAASPRREVRVRRASTVAATALRAGVPSCRTRTAPRRTTTSRSRAVRGVPAPEPPTAPALPSTQRRPWDSATARWSAVGHPEPGRNQRTGPWAASVRCVALSFSRNSATGSAHVGSSRHVWLPSSWPSAAMRATSTGWRAASSPRRKKVARAPWRVSTSSSAGVVAGDGPSSTVSAQRGARVGTANSTRPPRTGPIARPRAARSVTRRASHPGGAVDGGRLLAGHRPGGRAPRGPRPQQTHRGRTGH